MVSELVNGDVPRVGPYAIESVLGRGGMGIVLVGKQPETGQRVALKTLLSPNASYARHIRREIRILKRLSHPAIVEWIEDGVDNGMPWYAMEFLEGNTLGTHLRERCLVAPAGSSERTQTMVPAAQEDGSWRKCIKTETIGGWTRQLAGCPTLDASDLTRPLAGAVPRQTGGPSGPHGDRRPSETDLRWVLKALGPICRALAYSHGEGVVHCDLKPDNILLTSTGRPVLVDFGMVSLVGPRTDAASLETAGLLGGSVAYMAPEQIRGEWVDARADLYALGCMLYEIYTGQPPFSAPTVPGILRLHMTAPPPPITAQSVQLPALEALIQGLLQKDPRDRPGHAGVIVETLAKCGIETESADTHRARSYLFRPPLIGRSELLTELRKMIGQVSSSDGIIVCLAGRSGVGKTRVAAEAVRNARSRSIQTLTGHGMALEAGSHSPAAKGPLHLLAPLLRQVGDRAREGGQTAVARLFGDRLRLLEPFAPFLGSLPGAEEYPPPYALAPDRARERLFQALLSTLDAFAGTDRLFLVLDDLQWADELSIGFLTWLSDHRIAERPWLLLGLYRPESMTDSLQALTSTPRVQLRKVGRLEPTAIRDMIQEMLGGTPVSADFAASLVAQSEGNPFYVSEYLRLAVDQKLLRQNASGTWQLDGDDMSAVAHMGRLPVPVSVHALVSDRLTRLSPALQDVCASASVLGRVCQTSLLAHLLGLSINELHERLEVLQRGDVLESVGSGSVRFVHHQLREVTYETRSPVERTRLHRAAAEYLVTHSPTDYANLAHHWEHGDVPDLARTAYLAAGRHDAKRYAHEEAERFFRRALTLFEHPGTEDSLTAQMEWIETVLMVQGRLGEARPLLESIISRSEESSGIRSAALVVLGEACRQLGAHPESFDLLEEARARYAASGDRSGEARALSALSMNHREQGRIEEARAVCEQALAVHQELGDRRAVALSLHTLAAVHYSHGEYEQARSAGQRALAIRREIGDRQGESHTLLNLGSVALTRGELDEAAAVYSQALAAQRHVGDRRVEGYTLNNLGSLAHLQGKLVEATTFCEQSLVCSQIVGDERGIAMAQVTLGALWRDRGELKRAHQFYDEADERASRIGERYLQAHSYLYRAVALRYSRQFDRAHALLNQAERMFAEADECLMMMRCTCERGTLALARGESADAQEERVRDLLTTLDVGPKSPAQVDADRFFKAVATAAKGELLLLGSVPENLPPAIQQRALESAP